MDEVIAVDDTKWAFSGYEIKYLFSLSWMPFFCRFSALLVARSLHLDIIKEALFLFRSQSKSIRHPEPATPAKCEQANEQIMIRNVEIIRKEMWIVDYRYACLLRSQTRCRKELTRWFSAIVLLIEIPIVNLNARSFQSAYWLILTCDSRFFFSLWPRASPKGGRTTQANMWRMKRMKFPNRIKW